MKKIFILSLCLGFIFSFIQISFAAEESIFNLPIMDTSAGSGISIKDKNGTDQDFKNLIIEQVDSYKTDSYGYGRVDYVHAYQCQSPFLFVQKLNGEANWYGYCIKLKNNTQLSSIYEVVPKNCYSDSRPKNPNLTGSVYNYNKTNCTGIIGVAGCPKGYQIIPQYFDTQQYTSGVGNNVETNRKKVPQKFFCRKI